MKAKVLASAAIVGLAATVWLTGALTKSSTLAASPSTEELPELVAPGRVESSDGIISLAFEDSGQIVELLVAEGDHVEKNQVVARLDSRIAKARLDRARAILRVAIARRQTTRRGARRAELQEARAEADSARARAGSAADSNIRSAKLLGSNAISAAEALQSQAAADAAQAQAEAATAHLSALSAGADAPQLEESEAEVARAQADVDEASVHLDQTELRSPISGTVLRRYAERGEHVSIMPPTIVMTLAQGVARRVRAEFDEEDIGQLLVGQRGFAICDAYGSRQFTGQITTLMHDIGRKIPPDDDPRARVDTRVLEAIFTLDEPTDIPLGLRMRVHLRRH